MRKKLISVWIIVILVFSIYGCAQTVEDAPTAEPETVETDYTEIEIEEEADAVDAETGSEEQAEPIYIIQPQLAQDDPYEMQDWQAAYAEYIEDFDGKESCYYSLIYVDEDDIPELVIDTGSGAGGCHILTFHNGITDVLETWRTGFTYIEKGNLLNNSSGNTGLYYDRIHSIENGKWVYVTGGEYRENPENRMEFLYEWEGEPVGEEEYEEKIAEVYDREQKKEPEYHDNFTEMLSRLRAGNVTSQGHRYEFYIEDVTWDEAKSRCEDRGGYLATITTIEEYERIKKGIEDCKQNDVAFWVGASHDLVYCWYEPDGDYYMGYTATSKFWALGEPSYRTDVAGIQVKEEYVYLSYDDTEEKCFLYDVPVNLLSIYPEYTGKIGYICEYDSVTVMSKEMWFYPYSDDGSLACWYEYEYDNAGNRIKEACYNVDDGIFEREEYEYDSKGKLTKETYYRANGDIGCWKEYEYDNVGNQTKEFYYTNDGGFVSWEKEYDSAGNETKWIDYHYDGSVDSWREYEYDGAGNMIKETAHEPNIDYEGVYEYEYDDAGNQTKESYHYYTNGNLGDYWQEYEYEYDGNGRQTGGTLYIAGGSIWHIENEYDSRGKKTKETYWREDGLTEEYVWEYDNMGNLTKYMEYREGEIYIWREYEYITITPRNEVTISN